MLLLTTVGVTIALHALDYKASALGLALLMLCCAMYARRRNDEVWETRNEVHKQNIHTYVLRNLEQRHMIEYLKTALDGHDALSMPPLVRG